MWQAFQLVLFPSSSPSLGRSLENQQAASQIFLGSFTLYQQVWSSPKAPSSKNCHYVPYAVVPCKLPLTGLIFICPDSAPGHHKQPFPRGYYQNHQCLHSKCLTQQLHKVVIMVGVVEVEEILARKSLNLMNILVYTSKKLNGLHGG